MIELTTGAEILRCTLFMSREVPEGIALCKWREHLEPSPSGTGTWMNVGEFVVWHIYWHRNTEEKWVCEAGNYFPYGMYVDEATALEEAVAAYDKRIGKVAVQ